MGREDLVFRAGLSRFAVGGAALATMPFIYPATRPVVPVYVAYLLLAVVEQVLIRRGVGGSLRTILFGLVDGAIVTLTVHELGSCHSPLAAVYLFAGVMNALVVGPRVGLALSMLNAAAYGAVVWLELGGVLAYAPGIPALASLGPPSAGTAVLATGLVAFLLMTSTAVVSLLMEQLGAREQALVAANTRLEDLSRRDPLTGLFNRRYLFERVAIELARVERGGRTALLLVDLDGFKRVNDSQGHLRGDLLLEEIGKALRDATRSTDIAARYGGDEFVVLLADASPEDARAAAQRVAACIVEVGGRFDTQKAVTGSVGVAVARRGDGVAALLRRADEAAYAAKRAGGNRVTEAPLAG